MSLQWGRTASSAGTILLLRRVLGPSGEVKASTRWFFWPRGHARPIPIPQNPRLHPQRGSLLWCAAPRHCHACHACHACSMGPLVQQQQQQHSDSSRSSISTSTSISNRPTETCATGRDGSDETIGAEKMPCSVNYGLGPHAARVRPKMQPRPLESARILPGPTRSRGPEPAEPVRCVAASRREDPRAATICRPRARLGAPARSRHAIGASLPALLGASLALMVGRRRPGTILCSLCSALLRS